MLFLYWDYVFFKSLYFIALGNMFFGILHCILNFPGFLEKCEGCCGERFLVVLRPLRHRCLDCAATLSGDPQALP
ncbi:MAG: hypothetical protein Q8Q81_10395 [Oxalobacteraceae bacterium]|nr:hypothetical protein [Oxalobacteraceae bacterium]